MLNLSGTFSVAYKEALHILRDKRILILVIVLPPLLTLIFGYAFDNSSVTGVPMSIQDRDRSDASQAFAKSIAGKDTYQWQPRPANAPDVPDLLREHVMGSLIIPHGWSQGLKNGKPVPLQLYVDASDTSTGEEIAGELQKSLGDFQKAQQDTMIDNLPVEVIDMGEKLPKSVQEEFGSAMVQWAINTTKLYNPNERFIDYVIPGIIGLILQLLTVTLMACTITRERESGTLYQLIVTSLRRSEIVVGKVLPYLALSIFLIAMAVGVARFYFGTQFQHIGALSLICFLFLCCSLGLGLLISAFCQTQTQAIQFAVFYLLPVLMLSGAFSPLEQLPPAIQMISETFPLTHFCHAFRLVNMQNAGFGFIAGDLLFMFAGAFVSCAGAAYLLSRIQE
ncbi:MAG TPA: ABC transporter permease [Chthoniobacteraceae bacterium]|jgi:ABC-2 type transport system permease protein|nr:ABC transporter permease [Chthoniobacteraceae bacterium]